MAYTVTKYPTVFGNKKTVGMHVVADAATQTIETGLHVVEWFTLAKASMNSANQHYAINSNASGVQSMGVFTVTGCTSGDDFYVTVFGV